MSDSSRNTPKEDLIPASRKRVRPNRRTERSAVNRVRSLLEECEFVVQEVDGANDYGKDLLVDLTRNRQITGEVIAIQVKGGKTYCRNGQWGIPGGPADLALWRESSIPIFGVVHDPNQDILRWINLTEYARVDLVVDREWSSLGKGAPDSRAATVFAAIPDAQRLDTASIPSMLESAHQWFGLVGTSSLAGLVDANDDARCRAVRDCFALGRVEPRLLVLLAHLLPKMRGESLEFAVYVLSHVAMHPDTLWSERNWIPEDVRRTVIPAMRWWPDDLHAILSELEALAGDSDDDVYRARGGPFHTFWVVAACDPDVERKLERALDIAMVKRDIRTAFSLLLLLQWTSGEMGSTYVDAVVRRYPLLNTHPAMAYVRDILSEHDHMPPFG